MPLRFEPVIDKWLEEFQSHFLRQTALVELQLGSDDDDRAAGIVDALAEKVLTEAALLSLERVGQRLERAIVSAAQNASAAAVIEQGVDRFLKHALFVAHDDVRSVQLHQLLQAIVAIDDATIEIIQIRCGEAAAIQRHERTQLRRQDRKNIQNHPLGLVAALAERFENLQALGVLDALLQAGIGLHLFAHLFGKLFDLDALQEFLDGFRAHLRAELSGEILLEFAIFFLGEHLAFLDARNIARVDDHVTFKIENALEVAHGNVQQVADARRQTLEEPHMRAGRRQLDVAEAFAAYFAQRDFHAALVADDSAVLHALVFAAEAFPVGDGAKNFGAEQAVAFRFEGTVVDGLRLGHFAVGPGADLFRTGQANPDGIKISNQTGTIIRAASIQGMFLLLRLTPEPSRITGSKKRNPRTSRKSRVETNSRLSVTPSGVLLLPPAYPPLPRWATLWRPSGTSSNFEFDDLAFRQHGVKPRPINRLRLSPPVFGVSSIPRPGRAIATRGPGR